MNLKSMLKSFAVLTATTMLACGAQAKNYTNVFTQDFEGGDTYTNEVWTGTVDSALLGTTYSEPVALPNGYTVYNEPQGDLDADLKISPEVRTKYDTKAESQYLRVMRRNNNTANIIFQMPASVASVTDYQMEFDYHLGTSYGNSASKSGPSYAGTNGMAICMSSGSTLATFTSPVHNKDADRTVGKLFKGDTTEQIGNTFTVSRRGAYDSSVGLWLHIVIRGNAEEGVVMSVKNEAGTTILAETQLSETFDTVDKFFMKAGAYQYRHCISLDDIVVGEAEDSKTFTWTGDAGDSKWATPGNWTVGGEETEFCPTESDTAEVKIGDQTIIVEPGQKFGTLDLDATTKFKVAFTANDQTFTVPTGIAAANVITYEPFTMTLEESTYTATRNVATFTWGVTDGSWNVAANWRIGGEETTVTPIKTDSVIFPAGAAYNVTVESAPEITTLTAEGNVAFSGAFVYLAMANGEGVITLGDNAGLHAYNEKDVKLVVSNDLVIAASEDKAAYLSGMWISAGSGGTVVDLYGKVSGNGYVNIRGCRATMNLRGDWSDFSGTATFLDDVSKAGATRWYFYFLDSFYGSAKATFVMGAYNGSNFLKDERDMFFGALNGTPKSGSYTSTLEIGGVDKDSTITGGTLYKHTIRKVGTGTMAISGCGVKNYEIANGVLSIGSNDSLPQNTMAFAGGMLKVGCAEVVPEEGVTNKVPFDVSAKIKDSTADIVYDDQGLATTWATAFDANNQVGLVKKGEGTLSIVKGQTLNGALQVEGGKIGFTTAISGEAETLLTWNVGGEKEVTKADFDVAEPAAPLGLVIVTNDTTVALKIERTAQIYTYVGVDYGAWGTASNWKMGDVPATVYPTTGDTAIIGEGKKVAIGVNEALASITLNDGAKLAVKFTDDALSFTIPDGLTGDDIVASGPYTIEKGDTVVTATRVASPFTWNDATSDHEWNTVDNWMVNGTPTAVVPNTADTVFFPTIDGSWTVNINGGDAVASYMEFNSDITFGTGSGNLRPVYVGGMGKITLAGVKMMHQSSNCVISNDVCIAADTTCFFDKSKYDVTLLGDLTGSGKLQSQSAKGDGADSGFCFYGNNDGFYGEFEVTRYYARCGNYLDSAASSSSNAVWRMDSNAYKSDGNQRLFHVNEKHYFGAYIGSMKLGNINSREVEIGWRGDVDSDVILLNRTTGSDYSQGFKVTKVGTGLMSIRMDNLNNENRENTALQTLTIVGGTARIPYVAGHGDNGGMQYISFEGEGGTLQTVPYEEVVESVTNIVMQDVSPFIKNSTAPICYDDQGTNVTWATALDASNQRHKIVKKGEGTLTLEKAPDWDALTVEVDAGSVVVPKGGFRYSCGQHTVVEVGEDTLTFTYGERVPEAFMLFLK